MIPNKKIYTHNCPKDDYVCSRNGYDLYVTSNRNLIIRFGNNAGDFHEESLELLLNGEFSPEWCAVAPIFKRFK